VALFASSSTHHHQDNTCAGDKSSFSRRNILLGTTAAAPMLTVLFGPTVCGADSGAEVRGTPLNAFNGLAFQYRGNDFGGLKASDLSEPSLPYAEFVQKLQSGGIAYVEFLAPDGDAAYATLKDGSGPIRIGEGYPIEQHDGYSSPAFAIRTVKNAGVPYKFVVPALSPKNRLENPAAPTRQGA
jgi:hypothetical protein